MRCIEGELNIPGLNSTLRIGEGHGRSKTRCVGGKIRQLKRAGRVVTISDHGFSIGPTGNDVYVWIVLKLKPTVAHPAQVEVLEHRRSTPFRHKGHRIQVELASDHRS